MRNETAELSGAIIGDGWINSKKSNLFISGHPTEDKEYYDNRIVRLMEKTLKRKIKTTAFPYWGTYGIGIYRKKEIERFIRLGIPVGKKSTKIDVPEAIKKSGEEIQRSFLRGLFDTDGTIYFMKQKDEYKRPRIRIASISKNLIKSVKNMSKQFGITPSNPSPNKTSERRPNRMYIFEINRLQDIERWFLVIKPSNPKHRTKYKL